MRRVDVEYCLRVKGEAGGRQVNPLQATNYRLQSPILPPLCNLPDSPLHSLPLPQQPLRSSHTHTGLSVALLNSAARIFTWSLDEGLLAAAGFKRRIDGYSRSNASESPFIRFDCGFTGKSLVIDCQAGPLESDVFEQPSIGPPGVVEPPSVGRSTSGCWRRGEFSNRRRVTIA